MGRLVGILVRRGREKWMQGDRKAGRWVETKVSSSTYIR